MSLCLCLGLCCRRRRRLLVSRFDFISSSLFSFCREKKNTKTRLFFSSSKIQIPLFLDRKKYTFPSSFSLFLAFDKQFLFFFLSALLFPLVHEVSERGKNSKNVSLHEGKESSSHMDSKGDVAEKWGVKSVSNGFLSKEKGSTSR